LIKYNEIKLLPIYSKYKLEDAKKSMVADRWTPLQWEEFLNLAKSKKLIDETDY